VIRGEGSADHLSPGCDSLAAGDALLPVPAATLSAAAGSAHAAGRRTAELPRRRDSLPEYHDYADTGCNLYRSCLACPLPACRFDVQGGARTFALGERRERASELMGAGMPAGEIAAAVGVGIRTVYRDLQLSRGVA